MHREQHSVLRGGLSPGGPQADKRADGTRDADDAVVKVDVLERGNGDDEVAEVRDELGGNLCALPITHTHTAG